jgi:hypothetical protein
MDGTPYPVLAENVNGVWSRVSAGSIISVKYIEDSGGMNAYIEKLLSAFNAALARLFPSGSPDEPDVPAREVWEEVANIFRNNLEVINARIGVK